MTAPVVADDTAPQAVLHVTDLGVLGGRGPVLHGVDLSAGPGELVAVEGPSGSGRTSLLLVLAGRLRHTEGQVHVVGLPLPSAAAGVRRHVALGLVAGVNDLDDGLTVGDHLLERRLVHGRARARRAPSPVGLLDTVGLDVSPETLVRDLPPGARTQLGLALALTHRPAVVVADDVDAHCGPAERRQIWQALRRVADSGPAVVVTCLSAGATADRVLRLPPPRRPPHRRTAPSNLSVGQGPTR